VLSEWINFLARIYLKSIIILNILNVNKQKGEHFSDLYFSIYSKLKFSNHVQSYSIVGLSFNAI